MGGNGAGLTLGPIARSGASGGGSAVAASAALKNFASVSCILLMSKATVIWPKYSFSFYLYMS